MGMQQNTMWQQPPPSQANSTNPFAAPSGQSVCDCSLFFYFLQTKKNFLFFLAYTYLLSICFLFLSLSPFFPYLHALITETYSFLVLTLALVVIDKLVNYDLFTFAYISLYIFLFARL